MLNDRLEKQLLDRIRQDPVLLRKLSDRVYELLLEDYEHQRDRNPNKQQLFR